MSKYRYEAGGIIRDLELDMPYHTDDIVDLLEEKDQQIVELQEKVKKLEYDNGELASLIDTMRYEDPKINELQKQLEEKEKEIEKLRKLHSIRDDASQCEIVNGVKFNAEQIMIVALLKENMTLATNEYKKLYIDSINERGKLQEQYLEKCKQLKSQPAEIVEKIKEQLIKRLNTIAGYGRMTTDELSFLIETEFGSDLDTILKEYKK